MSSLKMQPSVVQTIQYTIQSAGTGHALFIGVYGYEPAGHASRGTIMS